MKWSVLLLCVAGLVAAISASILVGTLRAQGDPQGGIDDGNREVTVLIAAHDLPANMIVDADSVTITTVRKSNAPQGFLSDTVQVVGKVIVTPMTQGQGFSRNCFAKEGSGLHLASAVPAGMRAMAVAVSKSSGLAGLLYPGSMVDVIASSDNRSNHKSDSKTILEAVRVLSIENESIVSNNDKEASPQSNALNRNHMVTLLVNPEEAERLQTAIERGSISLSLRNPMDLALKAVADDDIATVAAAVASPASETIETPVETLIVSEDKASARSESDLSDVSERKWTVTIYRGDAVETREFDWPETTVAVANK